MDAIKLTNKQARRFVLMKQGFLGEPRFTGKQGVLDYIRQAGCIQFDPIDVCGKNAELVLQSRVKGFVRQMLDELLYKDRLLVDYFDKNLSIMPVQDWPYLGRIRDSFRRTLRGHEEVEPVTEQIKEALRARGALCARDISGFSQKVHWYWSATTLSRAALESMYFRGELVIHHKKGTSKYYALAEDCLPAEMLCAGDPFSGEDAFLLWRMKRRIGATGLLWNRASDAWLSIGGMDAAARNRLFERMLAERVVAQVAVEGIAHPLYCLEEDVALLEQAVTEKESAPRTELIAPLDGFLWDRRLIETLFGFSYKWEIYTPKEQRRYGYYVLPVLHGEGFAGRAEIRRNKEENALVVSRLWLEDGVGMTEGLEAGLAECFARFARFNGCGRVARVDA